MPERLDLQLPVEANIIALEIDGGIVQTYDWGQPDRTVENGLLKHRHRYKVDPFKMQYIEYLPHWKPKRRRKR